MRPDYVLVKDDKVGIEFYVLEHSNKFDIIGYDGGDSCTEETEIAVLNLTLDELKGVAQKLVNAISYFDTDYKGTEVDYDK